MSAGERIIWVLKYGFAGFIEELSCWVSGDEWLAKCGEQDFRISAIKGQSILKQLAVQFPEMFAINSGETVLIEIADSLRPELHARLQAVGPFVKEDLSTLSDPYREVADDFDLPKDRELRVNGQPWLCLSNGSVVDQSVLYEEVPELFRMVWMETGSMTSGWDGFALFELSDAVCLVRRQDADDSFTFDAIEHSDIESVILQVCSDVLRDWSAADIPSREIYRILYRFLFSGLDSQEVWGKDIDKELSETALWSFSQQLSEESRRKVVSNLEPFIG